jgi:hypothetical protein
VADNQLGKESKPHEFQFIRNSGAGARVHPEVGITDPISLPSYQKF